jgi:hypothetical protein
MSIWCSIPGTYALHYEDSVKDPRKAKKLPGLFSGDSADEIDLAVVPDYVFDDTKNGDSYLPYLRLGITANNTAAGDVILNRKQVKKLRDQLNKFLKDTKEKKEKPESKISYERLPKETMQEYSERTGMLISAIDWSWWAEQEKNRRSKTKIN